MKKSKISKRSREFSQEALQRLNEIKKMHNTNPFFDKLTDRDNALLLRKISQAGNAIAATKYKKFSFYKDAVKNARNIDAHSVKDDADTINGIYNNVFSWIDKSISELTRSIERSYSKNKDVRKFEKFGKAFDSEEKRMQLTDTLQSSYNNGQLKVEFDKPREKALSDTAISVLNPTDAKLKELLDFAKSQNGLEEAIQKEIVNWIENTNKILDKKNPFKDESVFVQELEKLSPQEVQNDIANVSSTYASLESVKTMKPNIDLSFYIKSFEDNVSTKDNKKTPKEILRDSEILSRNLQSDINKELVRRKTAWELEQIEIQRKELLKQLYEKIDKFKQLLETLESFTKNFGRLWDMAQSDFNDSGFDVLKKYGELLQNDEGLQKLANMIGRHYTEEQKFHKELRSKIVVETLFKPEPAYKGELCGLKLSDSITDSLPTEHALYSNPHTRQIFKMKYAQKQLLSYAYTRNMEYKKSHEVIEEVNVGGNLENKGPMIICVDTSGSMKGTPERVSKTITFALAQKSLEEERGCYLISFSTGIKIMDLSSFTSADGILNLVNFLRMSFNGGTDANPALEYSVKMLNNKNWKNSDVLMISDFCMGELKKDLTEKINTQKENKNRFFSLAVTNSGNESVISCFNKNWIYDTNSSNPNRYLIRQLNDLNV